MYKPHQPRPKGLVENEVNCYFFFH